MNPKSKSRGLALLRAFTLIELLVVVAIIAILAAIAVPNFLEAQTRAKVARMKNDLRTMATALESYRLDNTNYPYRRHTQSNPKQMLTPPEINSRIRHLRVLTSPIAYLTSLPIDIFENHVPYPDNVLEYFDAEQTSWMMSERNRASGKNIVSAEEAGWLMFSVGPDTYYGAYLRNTGWPYSNATAYSFLVPYDPTNGSISTGNIYRGQNVGEDIDNKILRNYYRGGTIPRVF